MEAYQTDLFGGEVLLADAPAVRGGSLSKAAAARKRWADPAIRDKIVEGLTAAWADPDTKERRKRALRKPIRHGTVLGYKQHLRRGEQACEPCKAANAERSRRKAERHLDDIREVCGVPLDTRCMNPGCEHPDSPPSEDHVVPLVLGGADDLTNLQILCGSCNSSKRDSDDTGWDFR